MAKVELSLLLLAAMCCLMMAPASAMYHIVGGSLGWTIPPNKTYYQDWANPRVFGIEDKLLFPFRGMHNVVEVGKDDFERCTQENRLNIYPWGPVVVNFTDLGEHYFYSGVGIQCELGQKFHFTVVPGKGSSGRIQSSLRAVVAAPALAPSFSTAATGPIHGWGLVAGFISLVAMLLV
ncbi:umecyanin-like [Actinidia eriantha]|uniref:umecyanin-like n=1 Tax=Actinidia eriantha TaxID=165200 RepID=UPI0025834833|nr:umecyanin-like [Actinidia eriantha]